MRLGAASLKRAALTSLPVHALFLSLGHQFGALQMLLEPRVATDATVAVIPTMDVLDVPATVPSLIQLGERHHFIHRRASI